MRRATLATLARLERAALDEARRARQAADARHDATLAELAAHEAAVPGELERAGAVPGGLAVLAAWLPAARHRATGLALAADAQAAEREDALERLRAAFRETKRMDLLGERRLRAERAAAERRAAQALDELAAQRSAGALRSESRA